MVQSNSVYFSEIEKIPLLSLEEERSLAEKAFAGSKEAQKKLVEANLRFVAKIAHKYRGYMEIEDLIAEGSIGLMRAAEKFNPKTGNKFSTYAVWWIKAYIQKAIRETATGIKFPANKYKEMKQSMWIMDSLDKPLAGEGRQKKAEDFISDDRILTPEEELWEQQSLEKLNGLLESLPQNERDIIKGRFGFESEKPLSLEKIGNSMGLSKERVRQIEKKAIMKLKKNLADSDEFPWLAA